MSNVDEVVFTDVSAILWIREKKIQISALSITFAVDQIPTATVVIAGIDDEQVGLLQLGQKARIDVTLTDEGGKERLFTLFHGRTLAFSPSRERGRISYVLTLTHWLSDLTLTSMHTHVLTGPAAGALTRPFTFEAVGIKGNTPGSMVNYMANPFTDLWGAIKEQALAAIKTATFVNNGVGAQAAAGQAEERQVYGVCQNDYLRATEIMERYLDADTLAMNPSPDDEEMLKYSVKTTVIAALRTGAVGQTLWDALTSLGRMFFFNFIPLVEKVRVASIVPNLKSDCFLPHMQLKPAEYHTFRINNLSGTHIRGVVLTCRNMKEAVGVRGVASNTPRVVGAYAPSQSGPLHTIEVPTWLYPLPSEDITDELASQKELPGTGSDNTKGNPDIKAGVPQKLTDQASKPPQKGLGASGDNPAINPRDDVTSTSPVYTVLPITQHSPVAIKDRMLDDMLAAVVAVATASAGPPVPDAPPRAVRRATADFIA